MCNIKITLMITDQVRLTRAFFQMVTMEDQNSSQERQFAMGLANMLPCHDSFFFLVFLFPTLGHKKVGTKISVAHICCPICTVVNEIIFVRCLLCPRQFPARLDETLTQAKIRRIAVTSKNQSTDNDETSSSQHLGLY